MGWYVRVVVFFMGLVPTFGSLIPLPLALICYLISPKLGHRLVETISELGYRLKGGFAEFFLGTKIRIYGDPIHKREGCVFIMNHANELDWLFFPGLVNRFESLQNFRLSAKSELRPFIGLGWGLQFYGSLFFSRSSARDKSAVWRFCQYFKKFNTKPMVLLFPEATNMHPITKASSDRFADKNGLPHYKHVLHPRTGGFVSLTQCLRQCKLLDAVYDIDVVYPRGSPYSATEMLTKGTGLREIQWRVKRYASAELPNSDEKLGEWCKTRWKEKEERLENFEKNGHFPDDEIITHHVSQSSVIVALYSMVILVLVCLFFFSIVRYYVVLTSAFYVIVGHLGGLDGIYLTLSGV